MMTPLDEAFAAMEAAPDSDAARLIFYDRLAVCEVFVMLASEPDGDAVEPEVFDLGAARFVLGFDREERLSGFAGRPVPYVALSGRALAGLLAGQGLGLALNPESGPSQILLPSEAMQWLTETLAQAPEEGEARPERLAAPRGLPEALLQALDTRLATAAGLARAAWLAEVTYEGGARGHLLGLTGVLPGAEPALAGAVQEALVFSGLEAGMLDVVMLADSEPLTAELARVGLRFDLPEPEKPPQVQRLAPGADPDKPPILK